jgi:peptidoglycan pentaglycine glycine transferase (the first glycine)
MKIKENKSKEEWDNFLLSQKCVFLQSTSWGKFKEKFQKVKRIEARENNKVIGGCQFFEENSPFGKYLYVPFGPVSENKEVREKIIKEILKEGEKGSYLFLRIEPLYDISDGKKQFSRIQPQKTLISRIDRPIEEILEEFHSKTRYNVRYARKKGVLIKSSENIDSFYNLLEKTKKRQGFSSYSKEYFEELLKIKNTKLVLAIYNDRVVAGTILFHFNKTISFLHSASDYKMRHLKAPVLLRFESIKNAKEEGCIYYDFWGIDEKRFPGVTEYKKGFGGEEYIYPIGKDFPIKKIPYSIYKLATQIKQKIK